MNNKISNKIIVGVILFFSVLGSSYIYLRNSEKKLSEQFKQQSKEVETGSDNINTEKKIIIQTTVVSNGEIADERDIFIFDPITRQSQVLLHGLYEAQGVFQKHFIVKNKETRKFFEYDFITKSLISLNFPDENHWSDQHYQFVSLSKTFIGEGKVLVARHSYDVSTAGEGDSMPGAPTEEFIYSFADNSLIPAKPFIQEGFKLLPKSKNYDFFGISSNGRRMFFSKKLGLAGCVNVAITNIYEKSSWKMLKEETTVNQPSLIACPWMNDSGTMVVYRFKNDDGTMLQLASTEDPTNPIKSILLPTSLKMHLNDSENTFSKERTVSWIDNSRIIISFDHGIALADFNNATIKEVYFDNSVDASYTSWDFYNFGSDGNRYVALTDWDNDNPELCPANSARMCPSKNSHSVRRLLIVDTDSGKKITVGDNLMFVDWIEL